MLDALQERPVATDSIFQKSILLRETTIVPQQNEHGRCNNREDDSEAAVRPPPIRFVETFGGFRPSKGRDYVRRGGEGVCESSIA